MAGRDDGAGNLIKKRHRRRGDPGSPTPTPTLRMEEVQQIVEEVQQIGKGYRLGISGVPVLRSAMDHRISEHRGWLAARNRDGRNGDGRNGVRAERCWF